MLRTLPTERRNPTRSPRFDKPLLCCLDQDTTSKTVEMYSCHDAAAPGNQAWAWDQATGHVVSDANALCIAVEGAPR